MFGLSMTVQGAKRSSIRSLSTRFYAFPQNRLQIRSIKSTRVCGPTRPTRWRNRTYGKRLRVREEAPDEGRGSGRTGGRGARWGRRRPDLLRKLRRTFMVRRFSCPATTRGNNSAPLTSVRADCVRGNQRAGVKHVADKTLEERTTHLHEMRQRTSLISQLGTRFEFKRGARSAQVPMESGSVVIGLAVVLTAVGIPARGKPT